MIHKKNEHFAYRQTQTGKNSYFPPSPVRKQCNFSHSPLCNLFRSESLRNKLINQRKPQMSTDYHGPCDKLIRRLKLDLTDLISLILV